MSIRLTSVKVHIPSPPAVQVILGQAHFIKSACLSILWECSPIVPLVRTIEVLACQHSFSAAY